MKSTNDVVSDDETIVSVQRTNRDYDFSTGEARDVVIEMDYLPLEIGFCQGCRREAMLPIGADPLIRRCIRCVLQRESQSTNGRNANRDKYRHRYKRCKKKGCATLVRVRKDTSGYCLLHAQNRRKKHCVARAGMVK